MGEGGHGTVCRGGALWKVVDRVSLLLAADALLRGVQVVAPPLQLGLV